MNVVEATVLGIVQGLTEFLPISSSGHLLIVPKLMRWDDPGAPFTAVIQLGTMAAVIIYFWRDLVRILTTWTKSLWTPELRPHQDARMGWYIGLGTIPIAVCGLAFKDFIEGPSRNLWINSTSLILMGLLLMVSEWAGIKKREVADLNMRDGLLIGAFQCLSLIPGSSRSGSTMTGALFLGYTREAAARYSFLLSIPAVVLSGLFELRKAFDGSLQIVPTIVATIVSFVVGYACIAWLLKFLTRHSMMVFVYYRVALGGALLGLLAAGTITAT
ncbi:MULTISPECIES: undecaprenyl-diphosphate phosphatase [Actinomadura]|uniref:Undecaprenyl-diphosphatase n=1 Tax=Actinomadura litoris TaxID=2678616 RepID=A0A7K1L042_9ACTN|nr:MULTISPECIES: undecaprenyl-diphosphate phosphatase [Actinomadura]MBT2211799.1 undecaprenyl-diphosphate phosphatase [Actinomadura sp. NEAU-AAG7]MUN37707.1 undecaprenyl-diphosphate phosphatase [Actinomadura litoris]